MTFVPKPCAEMITATTGDICDFPIVVVVLVALVEENQILGQ